MKRTILLIIFFTVAFASFGQTGVRVFGYMREVMPGIVPRGTRENGEAIEQAKSTPTYLVYLSSPSKYPAVVVEMWINGQRFSTQTEGVAKTPVILPNNTGKSTTLVGKTSNKVQQVVPMPSTEGKEFSLARKKAAVNELVVVYRQNGKYYSATLKKITKLEPQFSE
jgi:hypothetical protein